MLTIFEGFNDLSFVEVIEGGNADDVDAWILKDGFRVGCKFLSLVPFANLFQNFGVEIADHFDLAFGMKIVSDYMLFPYAKSNHPCKQAFSQDPLGGWPFMRVSISLQLIFSV